MKHKNPSNTDRKAYAPYNFVPLPEKIKTIKVSNDFSEFKGYNGQIDCEIQTSSILFTRAMTNLDDFYFGSEEEKQKKDNPDFYTTTTKRPVISGSTLRGLFRNLLEVISYSQLQSVTKEKLTFRSFDRTNHGENYRSKIMQEVKGEKNMYIPKAQCGYMRYEKGEWHIQPALEMDETTFARIRINKIPEKLAGWHRCKKINTIYIKPGPNKFQEVRGGFIRIKYAEVFLAKETSDAGLSECALLRSGPMHGKLRETVVYPPDPKKNSVKDWILVNDDLIAAYKNQVSDEQVRILGSKDGVLQDHHPVFYVMKKDRLIFFGHTLMMRLPYPHTPNDLAKTAGEVPDRLDMAKIMFGTINEDENQVVAGKLSFSDALCSSTEKEVYEQIFTPHVLASPKPTTFQHYLTQIAPDDMKTLIDYNEKTSIRGTKFYWHKGAVGRAEVEERDPKVLEKKNVLTKIRPVKQGIKFQFTIRFENLSRQSLGLLLYVLELSSKPEYRLKLGMGKAFGMGAVQVINSDLKLINRTTRYSALFDGAGWNSGAYDAEKTEEIKDRCLTAFEEFLLKDNEINPENVEHIEQLTRIKHLLRLMSWPGPNPVYTRYLEIQRWDPIKRKKVNEYKERKVLPDALDSMFDSGR